MIFREFEFAKKKYTVTDFLSRKFRFFYFELHKKIKPFLF